MRGRLRAAIVGTITCAAVISGHSAVTADWPQWRGPDRNGISPETGLAQQWPASGPPVVWSANGLGAGYGTVAVKAYAIQFHAFGRQDVEHEARNHSSVALLALCKSDNPNDVGYVYVSQLQEYGQMEEPIIIKRFDGSDIIANTLEFENRLLSMIDELTYILNNL